MFITKGSTIIIDNYLQIHVYAAVESGAYAFIHYTILKLHFIENFNGIYNAFMPPFLWHSIPLILKDNRKKKLPFFRMIIQS